jgi:hypothetical protein
MFQNRAKVQRQCAKTGPKRHPGVSRKAPGGNTLPGMLKIGARLAPIVWENQVLSGLASGESVLKKADLPYDFGNKQREE